MNSNNFIKTLEATKEFLWEVGYKGYSDTQLYLASADMLITLYDNSLTLEAKLDLLRKQHLFNSESILIRIEDGIITVYDIESGYEYLNVTESDFTVNV